MVRSIGRYRIERLLGRGAMGEVYRAYDPVIGRYVAIKTISLQRYGDAEDRHHLLERLRREARSAGKLSHPGIVTIHDFIEQGEFACLVMEFIDGVTLKEMLRRGTGLNGATCLNILRQTAAALDYAHAAGIVHRDIRPSNIIVQKDGQAKILDFGVAKLSSAHSLTESGFSIGTPEYMSPEQYRGGPVDGRADQFSLAVIAYEMLTGVRPFSADTPLRVMYRVTGEDPTPAHEVNPSLTSEVWDVLRRALSKAPDARFDSCSEFVQALGQALEKAPGWCPLPQPTKAAPTPPRVAPVEEEARTLPIGDDEAVGTPEKQPRASTPGWIAPAEQAKPAAGAVPEPAAVRLPGRWKIAGLAVLGVGLAALVVYLVWSREKPVQVSTAPAAVEVSPPARFEIATPGELPEAILNGSYRQVLQTSGRVGATVWRVVEGSLPAGLRLDQREGIISGVPARAGKFTFALEANDIAGHTARRAFTLVVRPKEVAKELAFLGSTLLPEAVVGRPYSRRFEVSGGSAPYRWRLASGSLPPGITLDPASGLLSGTPSSAGQFLFSVEVTDNTSAAATQRFTLKVTEARPARAPLEIATPPGLGRATVGTDYSVELRAMGGAPPYTWSLASGSLPAGLALDETRGIMSGVPNSAGQFKFGLQVADAERATAGATFLLEVDQPAPPLSIAGAEQLPEATVGKAYTHAMTASGGTPPYHWAVSSGALPPGLNMDSARGVISGTPAVAGTYQFMVRVSDSLQGTHTRLVTIRVGAPLQVSGPFTMPAGASGRSYSFQLAATGGRPPYRWALLGSPPPGLALDETRGVLSGSLTRAGEFRFRVQVADGSGATASAELSLSVAPQQGTVVWQGDLPASVPLIIQGRHASLGTLSGELPGTPVRVEVAEPSGVIIVQAPGEAVGWKNMVLASPHQRQTRIVIRWTETR